MSQQVVQEYIRRINSAVVEGLLALMTPDHVFCVEGEPPLSGAEALREAWKSYCTAYPTYTMSDCATLFVPLSSVQDTAREGRRNCHDQT